MLTALAALTLLAAPPGVTSPSFDCSKVSGADERLICSDGYLASLDRQLAARFAERIANADEAERPALRSAQRSWLAERRSCALPLADGSSPTLALMRRCMATSYDWRIGDLGRAPPDAQRLPAGFVAKKIVRRSPRARYRADIAFPELATDRPGATAFNAYFTKQAEGWREGERDDLAYSDPDLTQSSMGVRFEVPFTSPRWVTVVSTGYEYGGGAHGLPFSTSTTFDLHRGVPLTLSDLFDAASPYADLLVSRALERLGDRSDGWLGAAENAKETLLVTSRWTFDGDGAVVTFPPYAVAPQRLGDADGALHLAGTAAADAHRRPLPSALTRSQCRDAPLPHPSPLPQ